MVSAEEEPVAGADAGLLEQLSPRAIERVLAGRRAALRQFPGRRVERVAMLTDERHPVLVVDRDDPDRRVREVHDPVDARLAVRSGHLVVVDRDPGILVGDGPTQAPPWSDRGAVGVDRLVGHDRGVPPGDVRPAAEAGENAVRPPSTRQVAPLT